MHLRINDKTAAKTGGTLAICLLSALLSLVLVTSSLPLIFAHADAAENTAADSIATTTVAFVLDGDATIIIEGDHGTATLSTENPELTLEITTGTYVHLTGSLSETNDVSVSSRYMYGHFDIEDTDTYEQVNSFEKDVTAAGVDKVVTISVGDPANVEALAKAASLLSSGISVLSVSSPTVGETFTGTSTIAYVNQPNGAGTSVVSVTITLTSGILAEVGSLVVYCSDHGSAAPLVGVTYNYTATVLSVNQASGEVELSVYLEGEWPYNYAWGNYQRLSGYTSVYRTYTGDIELQKASSNTAITANNSVYSLEGAVYGVYSSYANAESGTSAVATMTTNASGYARATELSAGTYYVKEITAPAGYALDESIYTVTVTAGSTTSVNGGTVYDTTQSNPVDILLQKIDSETGAAQGSASLEGAEYVVEYYDGYYDTAEEARASGGATRTWVFATDEDGYIKLSDNYLISSTSDGAITSDSLYYNSSGDASIPLGTVVIYEYTAPVGYLVSDEVYVAQISSGGSAESVSAYNAPAGDSALAEQVIRGGVEIYKTDAETDLGSPQGSASFDGTSFEIVSLNVNDVVVDGVTYSQGEVVATLVIEDGYAATSDDLLPYGSYSIYEVSTGAGYLLDDTVYTFRIDVDGEIVTAGEADGHIHNQIIRGDLEFSKKDQASGTAMAGIPFRITSETTGESHIIVTDQNGYASTAASWNAHSYNTNGNDLALDVEGAINSSELNASYGLWFGDTSTIDDSLGALPYDSYTIEELACEANEGKQLVVQTGVVIVRNNMTVNLGTIDDPTAAIISEAVDSTDGDHTVVAGLSASITDYVYYYNLVPNREYTLEGTLVLTDTGEAFTLNGTEVTAQTTFTPTGTTGVAAVVFDLSETVSALPGDELNAAITVFEKLYYDGRLIASHEDIDETLQQIQIVTPGLTTQAFDADDEDQYVEIGEINIRDVLAYTNLEAGAKYYVVSAAFLYEDALGIDPSDLSGALGTTETSFAVSETGDGTAEVLFSADASELSDGDRIVLFEWVYDATGNLVAQHVDADDEAQTLIVQTGTYGKTGADLTFVFAAILALTVVGAITIACGIRRQRTSVRGSSRKASRSGYRVFDPFLYENLGNDR